MPLIWAYIPLFTGETGKTRGDGVTQAIMLKAA